jgi:hypothetical protein
MKKDTPGRSDPDVSVDLRVLEVNQQFANLDQHLLQTPELRKGHLGFLNLKVWSLLAA